MIDLIIPYYNNRIGLLDTLKSINTNIFKVTIIDDHSTETPIIDTSVAQVFRLNVNGGPGNARQHGINKTNNPYIMFIDTGDVFISQEIQKEIVQAIIQNPTTNILNFQYYHFDEPTKFTDNRMHGKVYKREFIDKYGITFCAESSYMNEDIGFNRTCRLICDDLSQLIQIPIIKQIKDENSLSQKNDQEAIYKDQTRALSLVTIHAVDICRKNGIDVQDEIHQIATALYYWFIRTVAERREYAQDAWSGAKIFYDKFKEEIKPNLLAIGNAYLRNSLKYRQQVGFTINILRFAHEIQNSEIIPNKYLTFSEN